MTEANNDDGPRSFTVWQALERRQPKDPLSLREEERMEMALMILEVPSGSVLTALSLLSQHWVTGGRAEGTERTWHCMTQCPLWAALPSASFVDTAEKTHTQEGESGTGNQLITDNPPHKFYNFNYVKCREKVSDGMGASRSMDH